MLSSEGSVLEVVGFAELERLFSLNPTGDGSYYARFSLEKTPSDYGASLLQDLQQQASFWNANTSNWALLCTSHTSDWNNPGLSSFVLAKAGLSGVPNFEFRQIGTSLFHCVQVARGMLELGEFEYVVVLAIDLLARAWHGVSDSQEKHFSPQQRVCREASGEAGVALLVRLPRGDSNKLFELHNSTTEILPQSKGTFQEWFGVQRPSSFCYPQRISKDDVAHGRHLPFLDQERVLNQWKRSFDWISEKRPELFEHAIRIHSQSQQVCDYLAEYGEKEGLNISDSFSGRGFVGSSGPFCDFDQKQESCVMLALGPGNSLGSALVRV